jgi:hypothetical protein
MEASFPAHCGVSLYCKLPKEGRDCVLVLCESSLCCMNPISGGIDVESFSSFELIMV